MSYHTLGLVLVLLAHCLPSHTIPLGKYWRDLYQRVTALEELLNSSGDDNVSFLVRLPSKTTLPGGEIIKFPTVIQNIGTAYNSTTGKFTAPVNGTYLFHVSATANDLVQVDLVLDDELLATAWGYSGSQDTQGSNMAVVHMCQGQSVWAVFIRGNRRLLHLGYTQFTGTLIRKD